jgi:hypothetical protein
MLIIIYSQMIRDFLGGFYPPNFPSLTAQENRDCWLLVISDVGDFWWDFLAKFSQDTLVIFLASLPVPNPTFEKVVNLGISSSIQQAEHHKLRESVSVAVGVRSLDSFIIP